jgi:hypothetical protein
MICTSRPDSEAAAAAPEHASQTPMRAATTAQRAGGGAYIATLDLSSSAARHRRLMLDGALDCAVGMKNRIMFR